MHRVFINPRSAGTLILVDVAHSRVRNIFRQAIDGYLRRNAAPFDQFGVGEMIQKDFRGDRYIVDGESRWTISLWFEWFDEPQRPTAAYYPLHDFTPLLQELFRAETWRDRPPLI